MPTQVSDVPRRAKMRRKTSELLWFSGIFFVFFTLLVQHVQIIRIDTNDEMAQPNSERLESPSRHRRSARVENRTSSGVRRYRDVDIVQSTANMRNVTGYFDATIQEFEKQPGVVIVTKIHDAAYIPMLEQMLCLLHQAYNHRVLYDIVVFTTEAIDPLLTTNLQQAVGQAKIRVLKDNRGLQQEIANLTSRRRARFVKHCGLDNESQLVNLTWWSDCSGRIAYNWQAEFRSWHIWNHPILKPYKWMMWLDADAFCSKIWTRDPIAIAIQHNTTILFDNFPQGVASGWQIQQRIKKAFGNETTNYAPLCSINLSPLGHFISQTDEECMGENARKMIPLIHGFFHITNMDFYRSSPVMRWAEILIGNGFLQRQFDDQVAVTVPAAYLTPRQSWLLRNVGVDLGVYHNGKLDGLEKLPGGGFKRWWYEKEGNKTFPEGAAACRIVSGG